MRISILCTSVFLFFSQDVAADTMKEASYEFFDTTLELGGVFLSRKANIDEKFLLAKNAVKENLKDPESATFRKLFLVKNQKGEAVCGEVNAKNSYGGYVGFQPFVSSGYSYGVSIYREDLPESKYIKSWCNENK